MLRGWEKDHIQDKNMFFHLDYIGNLKINDFSFFGERPFTWSPKASSKWITRSEKTLRRWERDYIEAKYMYFHLTYLEKLY